MGIVNTLVQKATQSVQGFVDLGIKSIPDILVAVIILILGVLVGKALRKTVSQILYKLGMARATKVTGFDSTLKRLGYSGNTVDLLADLVKFFVYIFTLALAADALNIQVLVNFFRMLYVFLPRIMGFVVILVLGLIFSDIISTFFRRLITSEANKEDKNLMDFGEVLENVSKLFFILLTIIISLYVLGVTILVLEVTYAVSLIGLVVLVVLGTRKIFKNYMSGVFLQGKVEGDVEIGEVFGEVEQVGRFYTTLKKGDQEILIPNSKFMEKVVKKK